MKRRALLLVLSVLVAAVGTGLIAVYVKNADSRALAGQQVLSVLVAKGDIPRGTSLSSVISDSQATYKDIPVDALAPDVLTRASTGDSTLISQLGSAAITIREGTPLLQSFFPASGTQQVSAATGNKTVVLLALSGPERLAGLIDVGSTVSVLVTDKDANSPTRPLVDSADVISLNGITGADDATATTPDGADSSVGLSVTKGDAYKLIAAQAHGLSLNLITVPGDSTTSAQPSAQSSAQPSAKSLAQPSAKSLAQGSTQPSDQAQQ